MTDAPLIVGTIRGWVHPDDGDAVECRLIITAHEHGVGIAIANSAVAVGIGFLDHDAAELADQLAEAAAASENLRRAANARREVAMREHAAELIGSLGLTWPAPT